MIMAFLSSRAFRTCCAIYAFCLLYLLVAPAAVTLLVLALVFRATWWLGKRLEDER